MMLDKFPTNVTASPADWRQDVNGGQKKKKSEKNKDTFTALALQEINLDKELIHITSNF